MKVSKNLKKFWLDTALIYLNWKKSPKIAFKKNNSNYFKWFPDGRINLYENCIRRHLINENKIAIITINNLNKIKQYSYSDIDFLISKANYFFENKKIKRVMINYSASIESAVAMLTCMKLGIHFCVVFEDLESEAILKRSKLFKPDFIFTKKKRLFFKKFNKNIKFFDLGKILFLKNNNFLNKKISYFRSDKDLFTLFTSGSTGDPKGIVHSSGGYALYSQFTCVKKFGMNNNSIVLTASDAGWINGHTYSLIGPLLIGCTTILLEKSTLLLNKKLLNDILNRGVTILYLPVTLIRLMKELFNKIKFKSNSLITLGSMGEPLAKAVGTWFSSAFNLPNKAIINTYYQTETGGIICSPSYSDRVIDSPHGSVGSKICKYLILNKLAKKKKEIKILSPWPGCMKKVLNGKLFYKKYWDNNNNFKMFDFATKKINHKRKTSYINVHGRVDDVINIRGHRIGSEEVESVVLKLDQVVECCAISVDDDLEGSKLILFVVAKKIISNKINNIINSHFGSFALPRAIYYIKELPKTRSGKILRRLIREILINPNKKLYSDTSTMLNPRLIIEIKKVLLN